MKNLSNLDLWHIRITAILAGISISLLVVFQRQLPPQVPLLYSRTWGNEQLVSPWTLWILPLFDMIIGGLLILATKKISDKTLQIVATTSLVAIQAIITLGLIRIIVLIV